MTLLFFHGSEVLGLVGGLGLGFVGSVLVVLLLLYSPPRNPLLQAAVYAFVAILTIAWFQVFDDTLGFLFAIAIGFPWSLFSVFLATFLNLDLGNLGITLGAMLNAMLIYVIGSSAKRSLNRYEESNKK